MEQKQKYITPEISFVKMNLSEDINEDTNYGGQSDWTDTVEAKQSDFIYENEDELYDDSQDIWADY